MTFDPVFEVRTLFVSRLVRFELMSYNNRFKPPTRTIIIDGKQDVSRDLVQQDDWCVQPFLEYLSALGVTLSQ